MSESLKNKTVKGVGWSFVDNLSSSGITFLVGLVLARLIRKTDAKRVDYNTVFIFNLVVSAALYVLLFAFAPTISVFFREPLLVEVMRVIGWVLMINALAIIPRTLFVKEINFKVQTKVSLISSISSGVIGIGMAFGGMGVWSLVGQQLSRQLLNTLFLWVYCKWRPVLEFSVQSFKELFGFGSKLLLSGLLDTIFKEIYYLVIGRCYTAAQLGQYTRASQFNQIFSSNLTTVVQRVSYPVLSSIQDEPDRLREAYRKVIKSTMLISFACMLGLAAVAKPLIVLLIGEKWMPAVGFLQIICFSGMLYPLHAINLNILQVKGRSDLFLRLEIIKKILAVIILCITVPMGLIAMCVGQIFSSIICLIINTHYTGKLIQVGFLRQMQDLLPTLMLSLTMWGVVHVIISCISGLIFQLIIGILSGVIYYVTAALLFRFPEVRELITLSR